MAFCHGLSQPNIVVIVVDDMGWNDIGYHSYDIRTPFLDKLANEGVKLENYFVQPMCTPSRTQLLSGRHEVITSQCINTYRNKSHPMHTYII